MESHSSGRDPNNSTEFEYLGNRKLWHINSFKIVDEPLMKSLVEYRMSEDRYETTDSVNGVSSKTHDDKHMPIIDLDFDHTYVPSTTGGHAHLYLNTPISTFRWVVLMLALRLANVIEPGYLLWSFRRGQNQVRYPGLAKQEDEKGSYTHGWFRKKRS